MGAQTLRSYFETERQQRRALDAHFTAWGGHYSVSKERLDPYDASQRAFDPSSSPDEAFRAFKKIYDELTGYWQVFRPSSPANCWPPQQIFETIKREFPEFSWRGSVNLLNFPKSGTGPRLESCFAKMRGIKPMQDYPLMAVSKFLHFYNPQLFPIYDTKMIWGKVFDGRFKNDFREFCELEKIPYDSARNEVTQTFLRYYMRWASSLMAVAHKGFMQVFTEWLAKQPGTELSKRRFNATTLYAAAFEFTAVGATAAS